MTIQLRPSRAAFRFSGAEALKLLFDVVTARIVAAPGPAVWWALLSPQGKLQAEGLCGWQDEAFWLDVDASVADAFLKRMRLYRLRAQVEIEDLRDTHAVGWSATEIHGRAQEDSRTSGLGWRVIAPRREAADWATGEDFARRRIAAGIAELGPDFPADSMFPHDIAMDFQHGIDFRKGCYIGQEVVSRMQHRGTARRRPVVVSGIAAPGPIMAGSREAGSHGQVVDGRAVGIIRLDRVTDPDAVTVAGTPVTLKVPDWADYALGGVAAED